MIEVFISLGSNLGNTELNLSLAIKHILDLANLKFIKMSKVYLTEPQEIKGQNWYSNQVIQIECTQVWTPSLLMAKLLDIELKLGRERKSDTIRYAPRPIDIDLLLFGAMVTENPFCILPHPRMHKRAFVLIPLQEIKSDLMINGSSIAYLLDNISYALQDNLIRQ